MENENRTYAKLSFKNKSNSYTGISFGANKSVAGEVVFNTGMVGYPDMITDPSYYGQILVLTFPVIGIYGVPNDTRDNFNILNNFESDKIQIKGLIVSDYSDNYSNFNAVKSLSKWLKEYDIPAIYMVDTRKITKELRENGSMLGKIEFDNNYIDYWNPNLEILQKYIVEDKIYHYSNINIKSDNDDYIFDKIDENGIIIDTNYINLLVINCGIKNSIIRKLLNIKNYNIKLTIVPYNYNFIDFIKEKFNGIFISNGPGNPKNLKETINNIKPLLQLNIPIFGICLGHQLICLASGGDTYKMKFGNRSMNQPVIDTRTNKCYITSQNHNFAINENKLPKEWKVLFVNANDYSNEGIIHTSKPFFSVQFHPEGNGGPTDTDFLFKNFYSLIKNKKFSVETIQIKQKKNIKKILLLGSGGISIGQAGEFDYSGSQCIKALKEENIEIILVNPNIATIQTSKGMADKTYFVPVIAETVEKIIKKEKPDGIMLQFGGQTALNCGIQLYNKKILKKYNVEILGTQIETIISSEDRVKFNDYLESINEPIITTYIANDIEEGLNYANKIGFPVLVRSNFSLGGLGSGFANNIKEFKILANKTFSQCGSITISKSLLGWKEVEYEIVRDGYDNCISVCNMENIDPVGIHTGESIVISPSLTLNNEQYYLLRKASIKIARNLNILGECNVQFAIDPNSNTYYVIELNARLSRSSALASKATGYPLAYIAAKLALGKSLLEIKNSITQSTTACFEPSLDYCIVKFPIWDNQKFTNNNGSIGSCMKSVGEIMSIGRTFEESFLKGIRMMNPDFIGFSNMSSRIKSLTNKEIKHQLQFPTDKRIYVIFEAFIRGFSIDEIFNLTKITKWFLCKFKSLVNIEINLNKLNIDNNSSLLTLEKNLISNNNNDFNNISINNNLLVNLKKKGFSDIQIANSLNKNEDFIRNLRFKYNIFPYVKQIDTLSAEFPAKTNYLYLTYNGEEHDIIFNENGIIVLGCGAYRIGSSVEFDWCAVSCNRTLRDIGYKTIMINYNPETVSTDYDESDRLYFEELNLEKILDIYHLENSKGVIVSVGGQIANKLVMPLFNNNVNILGTHPTNIDKAENRYKFSKMLDDLNIEQPRWSEFIKLEDAISFSKNIGFPVIIRPSYVLSGSSMIVAHCLDDLENYINNLDKNTTGYPIVISKFIEHSREIEMDGVACNGKLLNYAISEHVENAGVHSGDATLILPPQTLYIETMKKIRIITKKIVKYLNISGPFNIQYLAKRNDIKVIECNLRASRSFPFASKTLNINLIELATKAIIDDNTKGIEFSIYNMDYVCIKYPIFSYKRLKDVDPILKVEMGSTGEVACFGNDKYDAYLKSLISSDNNFNKNINNILLSFDIIHSTEHMQEILQLLNLIKETNIKIFTTQYSGEILNNNNINNFIIDNPIKSIKNGDINLVINLPLNSYNTSQLNYNIRRNSIDCSVPLINNIKNAILFISSIKRYKYNSLDIKSWQEYLIENQNLIH